VKSLRGPLLRRRRTTRAIARLPGGSLRVPRGARPRPRPRVGLRHRQRAGRPRPRGAFRDCRGHGCQRPANPRGRPAGRSPLRGCRGRRVSASGCVRRARHGRTGAPLVRSPPILARGPESARHRGRGGGVVVPRVPRHPGSRSGDPPVLRGDRRPVLAPGRSIVEQGYGAARVPFRRGGTAWLPSRKRWDFSALLGYLRTWSASQRFREAKGSDPVLPFARTWRRPGGRLRGSGPFGGTSTCGWGGARRARRGSSFPLTPALSRGEREEDRILL
jgi:hypothetical protein